MHEGKVSWKERIISETVEEKKTECQWFQPNVKASISLGMRVVRKQCR